ncbi:MAG: dephospho-CoA kinase [Saprospiraceae bacterium]
MKLIGLTGGIGSGKSTVANLFALLGIPVYDSDEKAKNLMQSDEDTRNKIITLLGTEAYTDDRQLNRSWIASSVFQQKDLLDKLNDIVHPAVYKDLIQWSTEKSQQQAPYLIQETAILYEENLSERFPAIILVVASEETRIERVMKRDNVSRDNVLSRISNQWPDEKKIPLSDYVIYNDQDRSLIHQVLDVDRMIRKSLV